MALSDCVDGFITPPLGCPLIGHKLWFLVFYIVGVSPEVGKDFIQSHGVALFLVKVPVRPL